MTKRIHINKCRRCVHYNGHYCDLLDLDPCRFKETPEAEEQRINDWLFVIVSIFVLALLTALIFLTGCTRQEPPKEEYHWSAVELLKEYHKKEIDDWAMLQLAIALTESRFQPDAVGTQEDRGIYQIRPIYVEEVNRVSGMGYRPEDAFSIEKSVEMFNLLQDYHNPSHDIDTAIRLHNKSENYRQTVLRNLEEIKRYEKVREELVK